MSMRVAFFGTPAFAVPTLERLLESQHEVVGVITQPDRPRGRGQQLSVGPVKALARARHLPVFQPERLRPDDLAGKIAALRPDIGVVAAYGKILPDWLLAVPARGLINVHASLLPRYRGASPVHRAVMAGDSETGVTIMRVVKALDAGPMLAHTRIAIGVDDTSVVVEDVLAGRGADLLVSTLDRIEAGLVIETPQDESLATYAPKLTKADGVVDWTRAAAAIHNQVRGLWPWPHAYSFCGGTRYIFHRSHLVPSETIATPGKVITRSAADGLRIACGSGTVLEILELQLEGKRVMSAREALAGRLLDSGDTFSSP